MMRRDSSASRRDGEDGSSASRSGVEERFINQQLGMVKRDSCTTRRYDEERFICQQEGWC